MLQPLIFIAIWLPNLQLIIGHKVKEIIVETLGYWDWRLEH